jgi:hypothetical protein
VNAREMLHRLRCNCRVGARGSHRYHRRSFLSPFGPLKSPRLEALRSALYRQTHGGISSSRSRERQDDRKVRLGQLDRSFQRPSPGILGRRHHRLGCGSCGRDQRAVGTSLAVNGREQPRRRERELGHDRHEGPHRDPDRGACAEPTRCGRARDQRFRGRRERFGRVRPAGRDIRGSLARVRRLYGRAAAPSTREPLEIAPHNQE